LSTGESIPWLEVLVQGVIQPKELCARFTPRKRVPTGPLTDLNGVSIPNANWHMSIVYHRWSVRVVIGQPVLELTSNVGGFIEHLRNLSIDMLKTWLHAQALYSNQRLEMDTNTVTVTYSLVGNGMYPMWVEFVPNPPQKRRPIPRHALRKGEQTALPAVWGLDFRRALRDYDLALKESGESRLIFLWRAAEEILRSYDSHVAEGKSPHYKLGAEALGLYYLGDNSKERWILELSNLAHQYARHSGERQLGKLPSSLDDCVAAAQSRVAEIIQRHARNIDARFPSKGFSYPQPDILTGWLNSDKREYSL